MSTRISIDVSSGLALFADGKITTANTLVELVEYAVYLRHKELGDPALSAKWLHELAGVCEEEIE